VRGQNAQLTAAKVSAPGFGGKCGNSPDISKGIHQLGMCKFESSQVSQPFPRSARRPRKCKIRPEMPAFGAFDLVSKLPNWQSDSSNWRKSPATPANIPVLQRLSAETGFDHDCRLHRQGVTRHLLVGKVHSVFEILAAGSEQAGGLLKRQVKSLRVPLLRVQMRLKGEDLGLSWSLGPCASQARNQRGPSMQSGSLWPSLRDSMRTGQNLQHMRAWKSEAVGE
jgi:hypothetical protein